MVNWILDAVRTTADAVIGGLGVGGIISILAGAVLLLSLAANAVKFLSRPKGIACAGALVLLGLGMVWWMPSKPRVVETQKIVREVVREIPPPVVDSLHARITGLEAKERQHKAQLAAQAEAARRAANALATQAQERLRQRERDIEEARQRADEPKPEAPDYNGECYACGHLMNVRHGLAGENIRCPNCGTIMGARTAWARRAYTRNEQRRTGRTPPRPSFAYRELSD